jgi:2-isopropylmalate synthase
MHLTDYKVRILDGRSGTGATTRVLIDSQSSHDSWSTVGASSNIIEASLQALVDSIEYGLSLEHARQQGQPGATAART